MPKKRWTKRRVVFLLLVYGAILLAAEAVVRIVDPVTGRPAYYGYPEGLIVPDDTLGHRYRPRFAGHFAAPRYRDVEIHTNGFGFRDQPWGEKTAGTPRVLVLGDSITFGSPLAVEQRFSDQAENMLAEGGRPVELCNAGVNGFAVAQYELLLRELAPRLDPDLVLIGLCLNDAEPVSPADDARIRAAEEAKRQQTSTRIKEALKRHRLDFDKSYAVNLVRHGLTEWLWRSPGHASTMAKKYAGKTREKLATLYRDGDGPARLRRHLTAMRQVAVAQTGAPPAVLVFPYRHMLHEDDPWILRQVDALLTELDLPHRNLLDTFAAEKNNPALYVFQDDCHPAALGHRLAAQQAAALVADALK